MESCRRQRTTARSGVSAVRIIVSAVILGFVIGLLGIEVVAAMGYRQTLARFEERSNNGKFDTLSFADAETLVKYSARVQEISSTQRGTEYRYDWFSLFRRDLIVFIIASNKEPRQAVQWATVPAGDLDEVE